MKLHLPVRGRPFKESQSDLTTLRKENKQRHSYLGYVSSAEYERVNAL